MKDISLDSLLLDQIIFSMENPQIEKYLDTHTLELVEADEMDETQDSERYIELPNWTSAEGFRLMENFACRVQNPIVRKNLETALNSGSGVFRKFKDTLKQNTLIEKQWFQFKDNEMIKIVQDWYQQLRERFQLAPLAFQEIEDTEESEGSILTDFSFEFTADPHLLQDLEAKAFAETYAAVPLIASFLRNISDNDASYAAITALTPNKEIAGIITGFLEHKNTSPLGIWIRSWYVLPEYRTMGISKILFSQFWEKMKKDTPVCLYVFLPKHADFLKPWLEQNGVNSAMQIGMLTG